MKCGSSVAPLPLLFSLSLFCLFCLVLFLWISLPLCVSSSHLLAHHVNPSIVGCHLVDLASRLLCLEYYCTVLFPTHPPTRWQIPSSFVILARRFLHPSPFFLPCRQLVCSHAHRFGRYFVDRFGWVPSLFVISSVLSARYLSYRHLFSQY